MKIKPKSDWTTKVQLTLQVHLAIKCYEFSKKIFLGAGILVCFVSCSGSPGPSQQQMDVLKVSADLFLDERRVLFYKTFDNDVVIEVLGESLNNELLTRNPLSKNADLDSLFDEQTFIKLNRAFKNYQSLNLDSLNVELGELVTDEQIPDYVRDQSPVPNWEVDFDSVLYLSTPIVSDNRAILLRGGHGVGLMIGINFFIKEDGKWKLVGSTF